MSLRRMLTFLFTLLTSLLPFGTAVDVVIFNGVPHAGLQTCRSLPPGICCRGLPLGSIQYYNNPFQPGYAIVSQLHGLDIAAVWARRGNIGGCSGIPIETKAGPGDMGYSATSDERALGASYIRLPTALPPGEEEANWLSAEGIRGLVWGGGKWFANGVSPVGTGSAPGSKRLAKKGIIRGQPGTAYIEPPSRWRWPDVIEINGTQYVDEGNGEGLYRSAFGRVLNMLN